MIIAWVLLLIVSCPTWTAVQLLIGSLVSAAGRLPALSTLTNSCTSCGVNEPVIWP